MCMIPITQNSKKCRLISNERKQIDCLEEEAQVEAGELTNRHKEILGDNGYVHYLDYGDGFTGVYICQNLSNYTL